jgi:hypothetical protein
MKKNLFIFFIIAFILFSASNHALAFTFSRVLTVGMEGQDVLELQKILNLTPQTQIAESGAGSPGNETTYFGIRTENAVKKLQDLYANDILTPVGLRIGTGFVGQSTITFLNNKKYLQTPTQIVTEPQITFEDFRKIEDLISGSGTANGLNLGYANAFFFPDVFAMHAGVRVRKNLVDFEIIDNDFRIGSSFNIDEVDFFLDDIKLRKKRCRNKFVCDVATPHETPPGEYTLRTSNPRYGSHTFRIVDINIPYPTVKTKVLKIGGDTLIEGTNFTNNMKDYTAFGIFKTDSRDNKFILTLPDNQNLISDSFEAAFYIETDQGLRSDFRDGDNKFTTFTYEK